VGLANSSTGPLARMMAQGARSSVALVWPHLGKTIERCSQFFFENSGALMSLKDCKTSALAGVDTLIGHGCSLRSNAKVVETCSP
jgi:hypothetical protein